MTSSLKETDLRGARDAIVEGVADTASRLGALPSARHMENFAAPIVEKIAREAASAPPPPCVPDPRPVMDGKTYGDELATVNTRTGAVSVLDPRAFAARTESPRDEANRLLVEEISRNPAHASWREKLRSLALKPLPAGHTAQQCMPCGASRECRIRETALRVVVGEFASKFGDPLEYVMRKRRQAAWARRAG